MCGYRRFNCRSQSRESSRNEVRHSLPFFFFPWIFLTFLLSSFYPLCFCFSLSHCLSLYLSLSLSPFLPPSIFIKIPLSLSPFLHLFPFLFTSFELSLLSSHSLPLTLSLSFSPFLFRCIITYTDSTATEDFYA